MIEEKLRAMATFYSARYCIDEQKKTPALCEISRRECLEIAVLLREAASQIDALKRPMSATA